MSIPIRDTSAHTSLHVAHCYLARISELSCVDVWCRDRVEVGASFKYTAATEFNLRRTWIINFFPPLFLCITDEPLRVLDRNICRWWFWIKTTTRTVCVCVCDTTRHWLDVSLRYQAWKMENMQLICIVLRAFKKLYREYTYI